MARLTGICDRMSLMNAPLPEFAANPSEGFRHAMRRLAATVTILSAVREGTRFGMTATAVTSVSMEPPALLCCVNQQAELHGSIVVGSGLCVNILHSSQTDLSRIFSGGAVGEQRFASGDWRDGPGGVPYLRTAQANIFCETDLTLSYGTHSVVIAKVKAVRIAGDISPLIYQDGRYMVAQSLA